MNRSRCRGNAVPSKRREPLNDTASYSEDLNPQTGKRLSQKLQMINFSYVCHTITILQFGKYVTSRVSNSHCMITPSFRNLSGYTESVNRQPHA